MKTLLRSCFACKPNDDKELLLRNYRLLAASNLTFDTPEDAVVWNEVQDFVLQHNHVPDVTTLKARFGLRNEDEVVSRLGILEGLPLHVQGDFETRVTDMARDRRHRVTSELLTQAGSILTTGIDIKDARGNITHLQGEVAAIRFIMDHSHDIVAPTFGTRLSGEVTTDGNSFQREYETVEADPLAGVGAHTGIEQMDNALNGAKKSELWIHAAFTGGLKSTTMLNWAYNQAVFYRYSSLCFSLEMPYSQCRRMLYAMHSAHDKFKLVRYWLGLQRDPTASGIGLPYEHIRDGTLHEWDGTLAQCGGDRKKAVQASRARRFLLEYVIPDLNGKTKKVKGVDTGEPLADVDHHPDTGEPYIDKQTGQQAKASLSYASGTPTPWPWPYGKILIEVADPDKSDFTVTDLRHRAEVLYSQTPFRVIFVDHVGLMAPRKWVSSTTERLNEVIRDLKRLAMSFHRGQAMAVVALFQINREGYKAAMKRKDKGGSAYYDLTHLSYANEAERCVISGTYVTCKDGLKSVEEVEVGDLVWSSNGWKEVRATFNNGVRRIWKTETDRGSTLGATATHRVRVVLDGSLGWKAVQDLGSRDYLASSLGGKRWPETEVDLPPLEFWSGEKPCGQQGKALQVPERNIPDLAYLLGAWDGDGKIHQGGVAWTGNRAEVQVRESIRRAFHATFGHRLPLQESPSRPGSFDLVKWSKPLKRWFEGVAGQRAGDVPECILRGTERVVAAYLRGLFDTDGWANKAGIIGIKMKDAGESFLRQVQMLLTGLGIDSHLSPNKTTLKSTGKTYGSFTLRVVSQEGRRRFLEKIGFTEDAKLGVVWDFLQSPKSDKQVYPVPETFLRVYSLVHPSRTPQARFARSFYNNPAKVRRTRVVPRGAIETLLGAASEDGLDNEDTRFLAELLKLQVVRVRSVRSAGKAPVHDLEVEGDHEYQTGPLLSHNSADIVTASWVDPDLIKANRVQYQCLKSRDQAPFEIFQARVEWPPRRILTSRELSLTPQQKEELGDALDEEALGDLDLD